METIRIIVGNLVIMILVAAFLELLLPLHGTRRFVQVIMGVFILAVILNPVVSFFKQAPLLNLSFSKVVDEKSSELRSILAQGEVLRQTTVRQARDAYQKRLEEQLAVMVRLIPGVQDAKARVILESTPSLQAMGAISKVYITVWAGAKNSESNIEPVGRIEMGRDAGQGEQEKEPDSAIQKNLISEVKCTVTSLFGLRPEQVFVNFEFSGQVN